MPADDTTSQRELDDVARDRHVFSGPWRPGGTAGAAATGGCGGFRWRGLGYVRWLVLPLALLTVTAFVTARVLRPQQQQQQQQPSDVASRSLRGDLPFIRVENASATSSIYGPIPPSDDAHAGGPNDPEDNEQGPRVALCFFGLTRSLRWTLPSVRRRLLGVLKEAGMRVDVFVHTYDLVEVRVRINASGERSSG